MSNPHVDVVATVPVTVTDAGQGVTGWAQYDEYGNQLSEPVNTGAISYGWHGADQRAVDTSGLILMGARLYDSATGLFTSRDPVEGGNTTAYVYPADLVGISDLTGLYPGVYVLLYRDGSFYVGKSWNVSRRLKEHLRNARLTGYTHSKVTKFKPPKHYAKKTKRRALRKLENKAFKKYEAKCNRNRLRNKIRPVAKTNEWKYKGLKTGPVRFRLIPFTGGGGMPKNRR